MLIQYVPFHRVRTVVDMNKLQRKTKHCDIIGTYMYEYINCGNTNWLMYQIGAATWL